MWQIFEQLILNLYVYRNLVFKFTISGSTSCTSLLVSKPNFELTYMDIRLSTRYTQRLVGQNKRFEPSHNAVYSMWYYTIGLHLPVTQIWFLSMRFNPAETLGSTESRTGRAKRGKANAFYCNGTKAPRNSNNNTNLRSVVAK